MSFLWKMSEKLTDNKSDGFGDDRDSYRCNGCCIEFQLIEELVEHVNQSHINSDGRLVCVDCQLQYENIDDFLHHYKQSHDEECESKITEEDYLKMAVDIDEKSPDNSEPGQRITIINEDGETVALSSEATLEHSNTDLVRTPFSNSERKRNSQMSTPKHLRDVIYEPVTKKLPKVVHAQQPSGTTMARSSEVEIDVSDINIVRLKTAKQDRQQEIFQYLQRVDEKLDSIIKHFNVPYNAGNPTTYNASNTPKFTKLSSSSNKNTDSIFVMNGTPSSMARASEMHFTAAETTQQEITQYIISDELLEATFHKSRNRGNFAKNLVFAAFPLSERLGRNCYGRRGGSISGPKGPLEAAKLDAVREAVFRKYPVESNQEEESTWKKECVIAIDTALRSELRILKMKS